MTSAIPEPWEAAMSDEPTGWREEFTEWLAECLARDVREDGPIADERQEELTL